MSFYLVSQEFRDWWHGQFFGAERFANSASHRQQDELDVRYMTGMLAVRLIDVWWRHPHTREWWYTE